MSQSIPSQESGTHALPEDVRRGRRLTTAIMIAFIAGFVGTDGISIDDLVGCLIFAWMLAGVWNGYPIRRWFLGLLFGLMGGGAIVETIVHATRGDTYPATSTALGGVVLAAALGLLHRDVRSFLRVQRERADRNAEEEAAEATRRKQARVERFRFLQFTVFSRPRSFGLAGVWLVFAALLAWYGASLHAQEGFLWVGALGFSAMSLINGISEAVGFEIDWS